MLNPSVKTRGRANGSTAWLSSVYYSDAGGNEDGCPVKVMTCVRSVVVYDTDRGLIDLGPNTAPRAVSYGETLHDTAAEAWDAAKRDIMRAIAGLEDERDLCFTKAMRCRRIPDLAAPPEGL